MSRRRARELAMQAIYQSQLNHGTPEEVIQQFAEENNMAKVDFPYFQNVVVGVLNYSVELDALIQPNLDRKITDLNPVELAILRLSTYELKSCLDIPYRVVINEGVELAKKYGATDGHKYVNGVLDKLAAVLRKNLGIN